MRLKVLVSIKFHMNFHAIEIGRLNSEKSINLNEDSLQSLKNFNESENKAKTTITILLYYIQGLSTHSAKIMDSAKIHNSLGLGGSEVFSFFHLTEFFHDLDVEVDVFLFDLKFFFGEFGDDFFLFIQFVLKLPDFDLVLIGSD